MAWNRCGYPTPPEGDGEDHRKCPLCGWIPCLSGCRLGFTIWEVEKLLAELQEMDPPEDGGLGGFKGREDESFKPPSEDFQPPTTPEDFVDEGDFE